jgi:DNA-binding transcriptional LysR family regulator
MNLRRLEAFRAAYLTGSVSRAAEMLHVSQPSVSRLISDLEVSVRFKLFVRTPRGLEATPEAHRLFRAVERSYVGLEEIRAVAESIRTLTSGEISLGVIPALAYSVMPEAIALMHEQSSEIRLSVSVRTTHAILDEVETVRLDLGLISPVRENSNIKTLFSCSTRYGCILPATHRLAQAEEPIDLLALTEDEFVTYDRSYLEFISADRQLLEFMQQRSRLSSHYGPVVAALAQATNAIAIIDPFTAAFIHKLGGVVCKPIKQEMRYVVALVTRSEDALSLAARKFAATLEDVVKKRSTL